MPLPRWQLWDRVRAYLRKAQIYRHDTLYQDQQDIDKILQGGQFIDFSRQSALLEQTNLQINRLERYKDYDMMDETGEVCLALDMYADESTLSDSERKHSVIVRAKRKALQESIEDFLYNTLLSDGKLRPIVRYLCKYGDFMAEIIPTKNRDGVANFRFMNIYNTTRIQTKYGDLVGFYFQDQAAMEPVFLHPWQVMHMRLTSFENIYFPYGKCCDANSRVWTPYGSKALKDINKGDEIYSFDNQKPVITKVLDKVINGIKPTLLIKTKHRTIRVTNEHPVMAIIKDNYVTEKVFCRASDRNKASSQSHYKRDIKTKQYVLAQNLKIGDKLVLPKLHNIGVQIPIEAYKIVGHAHRSLTFPKYVDMQFAKLIGFLIGDGWINQHDVCFAEGEHKEINDKYINIIKDYGYNDVPVRCDGDHSKYGSFKFQSKELGRTAYNMGLVGRCYEKRIPKWVFIASEEIKKAFIEGLVDSDGSTNVDEWDCEWYQIELTSEELVKDLKVLLDQMNIKCGNVSKRCRPNKTTIINGKEYERRDSWILYWYDSKMPSGYIKHRGNKLTKYDYSTDDFLVESIISIEDGGEIEVGDIQVSEYHNFIVDGVVIHNSILDGGRKDFKRLRLMEDAALVYRLTRAPEKRIFTIPVGNIPPKEVPQYMELLARQMKKHKFVDPATGNVNERYNPLIQDDDFWLPKRSDGTGPTIDTLPGAENLDQIADIEYFKKKMISGLKIPFNRVGIGDPAELDGKSLASVSPEFAKSIQWVQREVIMGLKKLVLVHLALQNHPLEDLRDFDLSMTSASAIDELYRIETWNTRSEIMGNLKDLGLFPDEWIVERFTDMTPDEIKQMKRDQERKHGIALPNDVKSEDAVDDEDKLLIESYLSLDKQLDNQNISIKEIDISNPIKYYVNANELDGLPRSGSTNELMIESTIKVSDIKEAKEDVRKLLIGDVSNAAVSEIAKNVDEDPNKITDSDIKLISEDNNSHVSS